MLKMFQACSYHVLNSNFNYLGETNYLWGRKFLQTLDLFEYQD